MAAQNLSPFVYWGQTVNAISLKVDLRNVENIDVNLTEDSLHFSADGLGVKGMNKYDFEMEFYLPVDPEKSKYRKTDIAVEFQIEKSAAESWPRLTADKVKLPWLKIDFDKFLDEDSEESVSATDENSEEMIERITSSLSAEPKEETLSGKQMYLIMYNLFQFIGYLYITIVLLASLYKHGPSIAIPMAFEKVGTQMMVCQTVAMLEVIHAVTGLIKSNPFIATLQVLGRNFVLFMLILREPRLQTSSILWYLFFVWSFIEVVRYPYYLLNVMGRELRSLTWLRYTIWIPLYPTGICLEECVIYQSVGYFSETLNYSLELPNSANFSFCFPYFLVFYFITEIIGGFNNLKYMYIQSKKQFSRLTHSRSSQNGKAKSKAS